MTRSIKWIIIYTLSAVFGFEATAYFIAIRDWTGAGCAAVIAFVEYFCLCRETRLPDPLAENTALSPLTVALIESDIREVCNVLYPEVWGWARCEKAPGHDGCCGPADEGLTHTLDVLA